MEKLQNVGTKSAFTPTCILLFLVYYFETIYAKNDSKLYF